MCDLFVLFLPQMLPLQLSLFLPPTHPITAPPVLALTYPVPPCSPQRYCDPRLNYAQSLEMSFRMAQFLQDEKGGKGGEGGVGGIGKDEGENGAKRRKTAE